MGSPKALLPFTLEQRSAATSPWTFLDQILAVYRNAGIQRATVVWPHAARRDERILAFLAHPKFISVKIQHIFHDDPLAGRLESVLRGLTHSDKTASTFIQDTDRPFITGSVLVALIASAEEEGYTAPDVTGHAGHPILLSPHLASQMNKLRETKNLTLRDVLEPHPASLVGVSAIERALLEININTPEDYEAYFPSSTKVKELQEA